MDAIQQYVDSLARERGLEKMGLPAEVLTQMKSDLRQRVHDTVMGELMRVKPTTAPEKERIITEQLAAFKKRYLAG